MGGCKVWVPLCRMSKAAKTRHVSITAVYFISVCQFTLGVLLFLFSLAALHCPLSSVPELQHVWEVLTVEVAFLCQSCFRMPL